MADSSKAVGIVVTLAVVAIVAAFLAPVAIDQLENDTSTTVTVDVGNSTDVNAELTAEVDSVDTTADSATWNLTADGNSISKSVDNGTTATYAFNRGDVNLTVDDVSTGESTATIEYPKEFSYSSGARSMWGLLGLAVVLGLFLYLVGKGNSMRS